MTAGMKICYKIVIKYVIKYVMKICYGNYKTI